MSSRTDRCRRPHGFTLLELVVVIAIIAALASLVAPEMFRHAGDARSEAARAQIDLFALALESYRLDNLTYPPTQQGLAALRDLPAAGERPANWRGPYLQRTVPADPWGRAYHYAWPGQQNPKSYDLFTLGRDNLPGGDDEDADITSWGGPIRP